VALGASQFIPGCPLSAVNQRKPHRIQTTAVSCEHGCRAAGDRALEAILAVHHARPHITLMRHFDCPEDVLHYMAEVLLQDHGAVIPKESVDFDALFEGDGPKQSRDHIGKLLLICKRYGWVEYFAMGKPPESVLTELGLARLAELKEEAKIGRVERWLRNESAIRGLTWGAVVHLINFSIAVTALLIALFA
jgi:hypothetical protein